MDFLNLSNIAFVFKTIRDTNFRNAWNLCQVAHTLSTEPTYVYSQPFRLYIEPTTRCNLECRMCYQSTLERPKLDLSFNDFLKILYHFPYLQDLQLQGIGEPLLNPDIFRMVEYAKSRRIRVGLFTNVTIINSGIAKNIINSGLDWVNLSLDAASPQTYEMIRKGARYEEVINNIRTLMQSKRKRKPAISLWVTVMKMNILELPVIIGLAKRLGIEKVTAQGIHFWGNDFCRGCLKNYSLLEDTDLTRKVFIQALKEAKRLKIMLNFRPRYFEKRTKRICRWPWISCFITAEGYVAACCVQGSDPKLINFGNIFDKDFKEIWNSVPYQEFRKQLKNKCLPDICRDCPGYYYK